MKVPIYQLKTTGNSIYFKKIDLECRGTGLQLNPFIIEPSETLPISFYIKNNFDYILIVNCEKSFISLENSQNVTIEGCVLDNCSLIGCSNIKINKTTNAGTLHLHETSSSDIVNSNIYYLKIEQSNGNVIRNCTIKKIKNRNSDNTFEMNDIPEKQFSKLSKRSLKDIIYKWKLRELLVFCLSIYVIAFFLIRFLPISIPIVLILSFISIVMFYVPLIYQTVIKRRKENDEFVQ